VELQTHAVRGDVYWCRAEDVGRSPPLLCVCNMIVTTHRGATSTHTDTHNKEDESEKVNKE